MNKLLLLLTLIMIFRTTSVGQVTVIEQYKTNKKLGMLFTAVGVTTFTVAIIKRSQFVNDRDDAIQNLTPSAVESQSNVKKATAVACAGLAITAAAISTWKIYSKKIESYEYTATINPFHNSYGSGLTLTIYF